MPSDHADVAELLELALDDPAAATARAEAILSSTDGRWWSSVAHHVRGIARREGGDGRGAVRDLRTAVRDGVGSGDRDRTADARASLGLTLVTQGRSGEGLRELGRAADEATDVVLSSKVLMRRGLSLSWALARHPEGLVDLQRALAGFRSTGDRLWEARTRNLLGLLHLATGRVGSADEELRTARTLFLALGHEADAALAQHNQGVAAFVRGDLPEALTLLDHAERRCVQLELDASQLCQDRARALLAAGLAGEAATVLEAELRRGSALPVVRADLELALSAARLAAGDPRAARDHARVALGSFRRAGRTWSAAHAELAILRARATAGRVDRRLVTEAERVATELEDLASDDAAAAWLLAGRLAAVLDPATARDPLDRAAAHRTHRAALVRATAWLARGLARGLDGDRRGVLLACRRGLDALDVHRATLGSSELRALASGYGEDLARLALDHAATPRARLWWSERWRATALTEPPARLTGDEDAAVPLAALRDNARRLRDARHEGADAALLLAERGRLEDAVRRSLRHAAGTGHTAAPKLEVPTLVSAVGDAALVELVEVGGGLEALTVHAGRVHHHVVGTVTEAEAAIAAARYALRRTARGRPSDLHETGERLQAALLGPVAGLLRGVPSAVVSPTGRLHAAPWALLPVLADLPHSVVPSAALWLRARDRRPPSTRRVFVCGPDLTTGGAEIDVVAPRHPGAEVLRHGTATVERSLAALDGARVAHIAAHGHFRADSPLFSALDLDDGPLTVHDFERMTNPPHRVVLSACESGVLAPVGASELLGLVSSLLAVGTAGVAASVEIVNDDATADLMVDLHEALDDGDDLGTALLRARRAAAGEPVRAATAASFVALGV